MNTEILPALERPPARTGFSVFLLEHELDSTSEYTGRERVLYPSPLTCPCSPTTRPTPTRHAPHALARARPSRSDAIAAATSRALHGPRPGPRLTDSRTYALTHAHTHTYAWARTHAPNDALVRVRRVQRTRSRAPHARLATGYYQHSPPKPRPRGDRCPRRRRPPPVPAPPPAPSAAPGNRA